MKTVGIIGGLGPETTSEFYLDIIFSSYKQNQSERPGILISSIPLPYSIEEDLIMKNSGIEKYLPFLVEEAKRLEKAGVDFIVIPCNSVHVFIDDIRRAISIPVLSIIEETVIYLHKEKIGSVGLISTAATKEHRLYEAAFKKNKITCTLPTDLQQVKMGKVIHNLVMGKQKNSDREEIINIVNEFEGSNVKCVALACTDLQLLIPEHPTLKIIDTMKILADATVQRLNE